MKFTNGIFIFNKKMELLIGHVTGRDAWDIPKGQAEEGEDPYDAVIRETKEEVNIDCSKLKYYELPDQIYPNGKKTLISFVIFEKENNVDFTKSVITCNSMVEQENKIFPELDDFRWVTIEEAEKLLHSTQVRCLKHIKKTF